MTPGATRQDDIRYMREALELAARGRGFTSPNPMVGAVVVKDSRIVGRGWHHFAGGNHAEVEAINNAGSDAAGADIYVTLEPCNHYGKTPPCTKKIIDSGIKRVVVGASDPNPFVAGGGIQALRDHGITVETDVLREEAETLIEDFIWYIRNEKRPFVVLKCASTLDGRLATSTGDSRWITCEKSRKYVHELRHAYDAIMVGSGTVNMDNPSLTARIESFDIAHDGIPKDPRRVILDSTLSINPDAKVLNQNSNADTIIIAAPDCDLSKRTELENRGATVLTVPKKGNFLDFDKIMEKLGKMGIMSILLEGGSTVINSALSGDIVNKVLFFLAPKILRGDDGVPVCRGKGPLLMKDALQLRRVEIRRFDDDLLVQGYLK